VKLESFCYNNTRMLKLRPTRSIIIRLRVTWQFC